MKHPKIYGICAPSPRLTLTGLTLLALSLALPVGGLLYLLERLLL